MCLVRAATTSSSALDKQDEVHGIRCRGGLSKGSARVERRVAGACTARASLGSDLQVS